MQKLLLQHGKPCHLSTHNITLHPTCPGLRRARLQELLLERGEASGHELFEHEDRERLATANAQRNIVSGWGLGPLWTVARHHFMLVPL